MMRVLLLLLFLALPLPAITVFVPPDEAKALFRRDLLPIDTDTMRVLSAQLTELSRRDGQADPTQLRATAQLLAIAVRLDPVNKQARQIGERLATGREFNQADPATLRRAKSETWHLVDWLLRQDAGAEGQLLGNQLVDALRIIDPKHPAADRYQPEGERARWDGVVAPLAAFQPEKKPDPAKDGEGPKDSKPTEPGQPELPIEPAPVKLRTAAVLTPLIVAGPARATQAKIVPLTLTIKEDELAAHFEFELLPAVEAMLGEKICALIKPPLLESWKALPPRNTAVIDLGTERYSARSDTAMAGPATLLVDAAFSGKTLRDDLVFLGEAKPDGSLVSPARVWEFLAGVRQGPGGRLLVPPDCGGQLRALLALGDALFFVKYEVLAVPSLEAALELGSTEGGPEGLAEAQLQFQELRRIATSRNIGQLAANAHVRTRLAAIAEAAPYHLSARMLLLQGSGKRPTRLGLPTLRLELVRSLEPMNHILWTDSAKLNAASLDASFEGCRKHLDAIAPFVDPANRALREEAVGLVSVLRTLARLRKQDEVTASFTELHIQLKADYSKFLKTLGETAGVPPAEPPRPGAKGR